MLHAVFPPECLACGARVENDFSICSHCWSDTPFIFGASCDTCGAGLPGQSAGGDRLSCDECHAIARPWARGRAVMQYSGTGRKLVLAFKHGDRAEIARAAGPWMARAAADLLADDPLLVPVPLHWRRLASRRFNQAALLARSLATQSGCDWLPDALIRSRPTGSQDGRNREGRFRNLDDAIRVAPRRAGAVRGRCVLLVDDVMTSGATFSAATQALQAAGAGAVCVMALARVARDA